MTLIALCCLMTALRHAPVEHGQFTPRTAIDTSVGNFATVELNISRPTFHGDGSNSGGRPHELTKRVIDEDEWQGIICAGEHIVNINDQPSYTAAVQYCEGHAPAWVPRMRYVTSIILCVDEPNLSSLLRTIWENPGDQRDYGWSTLGEQATYRDLHISRLRPMLEHYRLSSDPNEWLMRTARHRQSWTDDSGTRHDVSKILQHSFVARLRD